MKIYFQVKSPAGILVGSFILRALSVLAGSLCLLISSSDARAKNIGDPFPKVASSYLVKVNGQTIWAHGLNRKLPPASLTKIMTALLVLERGKLDDTVTVSPSAARETGTKLGLRRGERLRVDSLLAATLIMSANDACRALAEHFGKTEVGFVGLMNRRAQKLGLKGTHFVNACGHDHPKHYSTSRDLAILAAAAVKNPIFSEKVKLVNMNISTLDGRSFFLENKNRLIGRYPGASGVKTGYTPRAGKCLVALAEQDGSKALLVLLNAPNRWWDAEEMLDKAFHSAKKADPKR